MTLDAGWSMISLPVVPEGLILSEVFPGAEVVYGYERDVGYVRIPGDQALEVRKGYWILLNEERTYTLIGERIPEYTLSVEDGWYMIGGCSCGSAQASVDNGNIDVIYGYDPGKGYQRVLESESLEPGRGYWILFSNIPDQADLTVACQ